MKQGKTIAQLCAELDRQAKEKKDFIADTRSLKLETNYRGSRMLVDVNSKPEEFMLNELAHRQLADRLQIPFKYYERMRADIPSLLDANINAWFAKKPERRMLRTLDGDLRAFLSDRYRRLDNLDLAEAVLPVISEMRGAEIASCDVTENRMFIKVINKSLRAEIRPGDVVQAGIVISNSEVGLGAVKVEPLIFRLVCKNGMIVQDYAQKRYHVGRQIESGEEANEIFRDETLAADDRAFFMKVQDVVRLAVDNAKFSLVVDKMRSAANHEVGNDPVKAVEVLSEKVQLNQNERGGVLRHFIRDADWTQYGLVNAVTRASQDIEDYNRATELERLGGSILSLTVQDWKEILRKAA